MKVKITSLIGIGYWGKIHLKYLQKVENISIKSIFYKKNNKILNNKSLKKFNLTNKINEILHDNTIKFIDIVTPIQTHANIVIKFLRKDKKILVEKPLLMNKNQENSINHLVKKSNKLVVSYPYCFSKSLDLAKKIIDSKKLGKIIYIESTIQQCGRFMKYGVNHLLAPHAISAMSVFFNLKNINFNIKKIIQNNNKCETSIILCEKNKKLIGVINLSLNYANTHNKKIFTLYFDKGLIVCDLNSKKHTIISYTYKRVQKKNYEVADVAIHKKSFFDEKNNMRFVIENFYSKKNNSKNFDITKKINYILKNG